jgi:phosphatidylglycerophosphate synthase
MREDDLGYVKQRVLRGTDMSDYKSLKPKWNVIEQAAMNVFDGDPTLQGLRDNLFSPLADALHFFRLSPNSVSLAGVILAVFAGISLESHFWAAVLISVSLLLDGVDGVVARKFNQESVGGEYVDVVCDTFGLLFIVSAAVFYGYAHFSIVLAYSIMLLVYTWISAKRSKLLIGKFRSVGSRMVVTSVLSISLFASAFGMFEEQYMSSCINTIIGISGVVMCLVTLSSWRSAFSTIITKLA